MGGHHGSQVDGGGGVGGLVGAEVDVYWNTQRRLWSVRVRGRVAGHVPFITLRRCRMVIRETERLRAVQKRQRSVHAWVRGEPTDLTVDNAMGLVRFGYSPWHAEHFTIRPGYQPLHSARLVVFTARGEAWALI
jgi:hypothetical protein